MKNILLIFSIFLYFTCSYSQSNEINVNLKDGSKITYKIEDINKITRFVRMDTHSNIDIYLKNGNHDTYEIDKISKIDFNLKGANIEDNERLSHIFKSFRLSQNHPNPFNPNTSIQYEIPKQGKVELDIYDVSGRHIINLISEIQQTGLYSKDWNGLNESGNKVSSGVYIYTLKFENKIKTKKMILIK